MSTNISQASQSDLKKKYLAFGIFLMMVGLIGYLSNPEKAKTALISGGTFGWISVLISYLLGKGKAWALKVGIGVTAMLSVVFVWRSSASWMAVANGQSEKTLAATLITMMLLGAVYMLFQSIKKTR